MKETHFPGSVDERVLWIRSSHILKPAVTHVLDSKCPDGTQEVMSKSSELRLALRWSVGAGRWNTNRMVETVSRWSS